MHRRLAPTALFFAVFAFALALAAPALAAEPPKAPPAAPAGTAESALDAKVVVYYCHATARCANCLNFEKWGKAALDEGFAKEMKAGRLEWRMVNTDEPEHQHFLEDFQLYTKAIVAAEVKGGKIVRWRNFDKIWDRLGDAAGFKAYVGSELAAFLAGK